MFGLAAGAVSPVRLLDRHHVQMEALWMAWQISFVAQSASKV